MNEHMLAYALAGLTVGFWGAAFIFGKLIEKSQRKAAKSGFIEIDGTIYRLTKLEQ